MLTYPSFFIQNEKESLEHMKHESDEVRQQNDDLEHDIAILVNLVGNVMAGQKIEVWVSSLCKFYTMAL